MCAAPVNAVKAPIQFPARESSKLEVGAEHCCGGLQGVGACLWFLKASHPLGSSHANFGIHSLQCSSLTSWVETLAKRFFIHTKFFQAGYLMISSFLLSQLRHNGGGRL